MNWTKWHGEFHRLLREKNILPRGSSILIGVSGGQDSLCLLGLLKDLRDRWQWRLGVIHCDHGWREDSRANADYVRTLCKDLPYWLETNKGDIKSEGAAREWRYQSFNKIAKQEGFHIIVTGHTQTDRAETLLYNLIRGSGTDGLCSLDWERGLSDGISLVRPLLNLSRKETGLFCESHGIRVWEDSTNTDTRYARNRLRQEVIPYLREHLNVQVDKHLAQTADILRAEVDYLEGQTDTLYREAYDNGSLNRILIKDQPLALQRRVIKRFIEEHSGCSSTFEHVESVREALNNSQIKNLRGGLTIRVIYPYLIAHTKENS